MDSSVFDQAQFLLRTQVPCPCGLAQEILANPAIAGVTAFPAHQLPQPSLCSDDTFTRRLLEQMSGDVFDVRVFAQARAVQQPLGHPHRKALG
ncbi:Acyl-CoA dehydrogenase [Pseudomonas serbica]